MLIDGQVKVQNLEKCPISYGKYLHQIGTVQLIDRLSFNGRTKIGIVFLQDEGIHQDYYQECKKNKIMPLKPHTVYFNEDNLVFG